MQLLGRFWLDFERIERLRRDRAKPASGSVGMKFGVPDGIRTRVLALKGRRPRPLDDGDAISTRK